MTAAGLLPIAVVIPLVGAAISPLLARWHRRLPLTVGIAAMAGAAAVLCSAVPSVYGDHRVVVEYLSGEGPAGGHALGIAFAADPFGLMFALLTCLLGLVLFVSLLSELGHIGPRELGGLGALTQLLLGALVGAALTADTVNLFVWFEVAALSSYGLTGFFLERPIALEAAFKILVLTSIAGFVVFVAAGLLYSRYGALNFGQLHLAVQGHIGPAAMLALGLMLSGFLTKAGVMPFHAWLPDAHTPVPGAISALFSGLMVDLGVVGVARIGFQVFGAGTGHRLLGLLTVLGLVSAVAGAVLALAQDDLKRLLAWDTVSQIGVVLVGLATGRDVGVTGAIYHLVNHGIFKSLLFLAAGSVVHATGETELSKMGGLARSRPVTAASFALGVAAIAGIPPLNGFASLSMIHEGLSGEPAVYAVAIVSQVVTIAALGRATYLAFFRRRRAPYEHLEPSRLGGSLALGSLGIATVVLGVFAAPIATHVAGPAASFLLHPDHAAAIVLGSGGSVPASVAVFSYTAHSVILTGIEVVLGCAVAVEYLRISEPRPVTWLRHVHTGSTNDYAAFSAVGLIVVCCVLLR